MNMDKYVNINTHYIIMHADVRVQYILTALSATLASGTFYIMLYMVP